MILLKEPLCWAVLLGALGMWLILPRGGVRGRFLGALLALVSLALFASRATPLAGWAASSLFWILAGITIIAAGATVSMRSPMYSAIWFAMTLLGTAGLMLFQGAQFLAVATIVVYAGAILVTFLFVLMLAQPEGHAYYDRTSWGWPGAAFSALAGSLMVGILTLALAGLPNAQDIKAKVLAALPAFTDADGQPVLTEKRVIRASRWRARDGMTVVQIDLRMNDGHLQLLEEQLLKEHLSEEGEKLVALPPEKFRLLIFYQPDDVLTSQHMARLGGQLFSRHLISVEVAGTLLLAALVGAVAIVIQGRGPGASEGGEPTDE